MNRPIANPHLRYATASLGAFGLATAITWAQAPVTSPPGTVPLPKGPVPIGPQAVPPRPEFSTPKADRPLTHSPGAEILQYVTRGRPLRIDEAVSIALSTNRSLATALSNLERAGGRTSEVRTQLSPTLGIGAQISYYDRPTIANFGDQSIVIQNRFNPIITPTVTLPLDLFGSIRSAVSQAQFNEVAARIDVNRTRNQLVFDVRNAFYGALRAQGQLVVAQDTLSNALARLEDAQRNLSVGTGSQFDVITAQRDVADAQQAVVNSKGQVSVSLAVLKNTMGINLSTPLKIQDTGAVEEPPGVTPITPPPINPGPDPTKPLPTPPGDRPPAPVPTTPDVKTITAPDVSGELHIAQDEVEFGPEYGVALREALQTRPEILEAEASISAAQRGITYARRSTLPGVSVSASYIYQPNAAGFALEQQGVVTLNLNIPIYDAGLTRARLRQARADVANAEVNRRDAEDQVTLDVQQAYIALVQARDRVQVANVGLAQAQVAFRLARVRAAAGVTNVPLSSPQLELSNAQVTLTQAETNRVNALYDYNVARSQLDRAIGRYSYGAGGGYQAVPGPTITGGPSRG